MSNSESARTSAERITLTTSLLILVGIIGLAAWTSSRTGNDPPSIEVTTHLEDIRESAGVYYLPISILNSGGQTAQDVTISAELTAVDGTVEDAEVTITFLAGGEQERAEIVFTSDPREGELTVAPSSLAYP